MSVGTGGLVNTRISEILQQAEENQALSIPFGDGASLLIGHHGGHVLVQVQPSPRPDGSIPDIISMTMGSQMAEITGRVLLSYAERLGGPGTVRAAKMN